MHNASKFNPWDGKKMRTASLQYSSIYWNTVTCDLFRQPMSIVGHFNPQSREQLAHMVSVENKGAYFTIYNH